MDFELYIHSELDDSRDLDELETWLRDALRNRLSIAGASSLLGVSLDGVTAAAFAGALMGWIARRSDKPRITIRTATGEVVEIDSRRPADLQALAALLARARER